MKNKFRAIKLIQSMPSIKKKFLFINVFAVSFALLLVGFIIFLMQIVLYRKTMVDTLMIQAKIIGDNSTAAILFEDPKDAAETLSSLKTDPNIDYALLYTKDGNLFAAYNKDGLNIKPKYNLLPIDEGYSFTTKYLSLFKHIKIGNDRVGTIYIQANLKNFYSQLFLQFVIIFSGLLISFIIAYKLSKVMLGSIVQPIINLSDLMREISQKKDFSLRTEYQGKDEINVLSESFNEMIKEIQMREEELKEHARKLQSAQAQLIHSSRLSSLGEMATGIAHEINQPLSIIRLSCQSLIHNAEDGIIPPINEHVKKALVNIDAQIERMNAIITHLRLFARKDLEKVVSLVDINEPLNNVFLLIGESLKLKGIKVNKILSKSPLITKGNSNMIEQVLFNIINNAKEAMETLPEGEDKILTLETKLTDENMIEIRISDTAKGIPVEIRDKIFEPFFTTKEVGKGTGLGLSISYGIVKEFGGDIRFEVTENVGTTFIVTFPKADSVQ